MFRIPAFKSLKQEEQEFKTSYITNSRSVWAIRGLLVEEEKREKNK